MYELPHIFTTGWACVPRVLSPMGGSKRPHKIKERIWEKNFGNIEKILDILRIDGEYPAGLPKGKFWQLSYINCNTSCNIAKTQLQKICRKIYFTWFREFVNNMLSKIVCLS